MASTLYRRALPRVPRLASDSLRSWIAVAVAAVPQVVITVWSNVVGSGDEYSSVIGFTLTLAVFYLAYLALSWWVFWRRSPEELRHIVRASNPSARMARFHRLTAMDSTSWVLAAVLTALVVVAYTLLEPATRRAPVPLLLAGVMVVLAWAVMQVSATTMLMRLDAHEHTLDFPDPGPHGLGDYTYVATQVLSTFATSDVPVLTTSGRRTITTLSIAALVFNTVVVALLVSAFLGLTA